MSGPAKHKYHPDHDSATRVKDKKAYDRNMDRAGIAKQHRNGVSSQRGRSTIIFKNGKKIVVRENGKVVNPEEVKPLKRMKISMWDLLESTGNIEYVDKSAV